MEETATATTSESLEDVLEVILVVAVKALTAVMAIYQVPSNLSLFPGTCVTPGLPTSLLGGQRDCLAAWPGVWPY